MDVVRLVESETAKNTLRELFDVARRKEHFTDIEGQTVLNAIKKRNLLIHSYWDNHTNLLTTSGGRERVTDELYAIREYLRKANAIVTSLNDRYLADYHLSTEDLKEKAKEVWQPDTEDSGYVF